MSYSIQKGFILNILEHTEIHYSIEEIHKKLMDVVPKISLMTIYRNINKLVKAGEILEFHVNHVAHYCGNIDPHYHLHCIDCGKINDIHVSEDEIFNAHKIAIRDCFTPISNAVIIKGLCKECNERKKYKSV